MGYLLYQSECCYIKLLYWKYLVIYHIKLRYRKLPCWGIYHIKLRYRRIPCWGICIFKVFIVHIDKYLVEVLLSWSECKTSLVKLKHMLKKSNELKKYPYCWSTCWKIKWVKEITVLLFNRICEFSKTFTNLRWILVIFSDRPNKKAANIVLVLNCFCCVLNEGSIFSYITLVV